jgi:hypothetical protein
MRFARTALALLLSVAMAAVAGCGSGDGGGSPRERGLRSTIEGSYQVKSVEDGITQGVGIYDNGSFRVVVEGTSRLVIYNRKRDESWLVSLTQKTYEPITYDDAISRAGFMPHIVMEPYFEMTSSWNGPEFRMDTADGRSIMAFLEGPEFLPSSWRAESQGETFKEITWEYRHVGHVSPANFEPPQDFTPSGQQ